MSEKSNAQEGFSKKNLWKTFKDKCKSYSDCAKEKEWMKGNSTLIRKLFENIRFSPIPHNSIGAVLTSFYFYPQ